MRLPVVLALLLSGFAVHAADTRIPDADLAIAKALRDRALAGSDAFEIVESLTTEVGHRMPGSENDARGVAWAIAKLQELGFDRVWTEPVTFPVWTRGEESARVVVPREQPLAIAALGGSVGTPPEGVRGEIVHFEDFAALQAASAEEVRGRIAYVGYRMQRTRDGSGYGAAVGVRVAGAAVAGRLGAKALLIRSVGTADSRFPHTGIMRYGDGITRIPAAAVSNADADLIENLLRRGRVEVEIRLGARERGEYTSQNVIAEITGRERPEQFALMGAHLDSWDLGTGAIDDGAGIGITFAAGRLILDLDQRPRRSIRVIAFAAEEIGLLGARAYQAKHVDNVSNHLIGGESDFGGGRIYQLDAAVKPQARGAIDQMLTVLAPLGIEKGREDASGGPDFGPMRRSGMAAIDLRQDGTAYFDYHHTADDTLDKLVPAELDQNVAAWAAVMWMAANAEGDFGSGEPPLAPAELP
jgi:Zn-dependent M28 family amino/carboxypeptidase